jgi:hypothetical protein
MPFNVPRFERTSHFVFFTHRGIMNKIAHGISDDAMHIPTYILAYSKHTFYKKKRKITKQTPFYLNTTNIF